ncbi:AAA family ATPase [Nocardioides acrostichi]|uniref:Nuclease SbcCD subunit C n=1 Tax=Nocardioides acrostichi TaxID=2784339 RepID=A0A930V318_9ACTN|nr:SMC family ATPase [Nocardioides acrostichi]MBF4163765.1 SMC family ATPase [Nocardioides acrostichi]
MRLHHLEITAFGPFAGTVTVDFDALSGGGLFLLTGATGAGKTTVLDAVCFALYGDVPGDRSGAKRLRSDQAAPGVRPGVVLEATLGGRRLRFVRSPAWSRPKKRGTGTTTEQASVSVSEHIDGTWEPLSSRLDEAGDLVGSLLGLTLNQFTQVAMLPQGRFSTFLRATSKERHALLQQLFRTGRFESVEAWLGERRRHLYRSSQSCEREVDDLASRVSEIAEEPAPEDPDALAAWSQAAHVTAAAERDAAQQHLERDQLAETAAVGALDDVRHRLERAQQRRAAERELATLEQRAADHAEDLARLDGARRAAPVVPLAEVSRRAGEACDGAAERWRRAAEAVPGVEPEALASRLERLLEARATMTALDPGRRRLGWVQQQLPRVRAEAAQTATERDRVAVRLAELPDQLTAAAAAVESARSRAAETADLATRLTAHDRARGLRAELAAAQVEHLASRELVLAASERQLEVRRQRIEAMAAELAGALAVGACCPVCGSDDHPHKAVPARGAVDEGTERSTQRALDDAKASETVHAEHVASLRTRLAVAEAAAGADRREEVAAQLDAAHDHERALPDLRAEHDRLRAEHETARLRWSELAATGSALEADIAAFEREAVDLAGEIDRAEEQIRAATGADSLDLDGLLAATRAAAEALTTRTRARARAEEARADLDDALTAAGFGDVHEVETAALGEAEQGVLSNRVDHHRERSAVVREQLGQLGDADRDPRPLHELVALRADEHEAAVRRVRAAGEHRAAAQARCGRLQELDARLRVALERWEPVRREYELVTRVAAFAEGKAADNAWQMRLSAYVLAWRLGQVVAAANERLVTMSDHRYTLLHSARRGAGETRGGLSLLVRDDWSGEARDPATLSGGETFVVSLALALGLADVVAHEAGGAQLETLFVDEGFGSLDSDTLEDVLDALDALREGGRVVGVVSHVTEMRDRIPTQLHVRTSRAGSTVSLHGAAPVVVGSPA